MVPPPTATVEPCFRLPPVVAPRPRLTRFFRRPVVWAAAAPLSPSQHHNQFAPPCPAVRGWRRLFLLLVGSLSNMESSEVSLTPLPRLLRPRSAFPPAPPTTISSHSLSPLYSRRSRKCFSATWSIACCSVVTSASTNFKPLVRCSTFQYFFPLAQSTNTIRKPAFTLVTCPTTDCIPSRFAVWKTTVSSPPCRQ